MYAIMALCFPICTFLIFTLRSMSARRPSSSFCNSYFLYFIYSVFLLCSLCSNIKPHIYILCIRWFIFLCFFHRLVDRISFIILEGSVLFVLVGSVSASFESFFFRQYFCFIFSSVLSVCCCLFIYFFFFCLFIPLCRCVFFLTLCFSLFLQFIYLSKPHFHLSFIFPFVFFGEGNQFYHYLNSSINCIV